jgi:hypothetical protein
MEPLEEQAAAFVEDSFSIAQVAHDLNRADLAASDAGVAGILRNTQLPFYAARYGAADVARDAFHLGVVETIDRDTIIGSEPAKVGTHTPDRAPLGSAVDP